jgi:hypothetical protein
MANAWHGSPIGRGAKVKISPRLARARRTWFGRMLANRGRPDAGVSAVPLTREVLEPWVRLRHQAPNLASFPRRQRIG